MSEIIKKKIYDKIAKILLKITSVWYTVTEMFKLPDTFKGNVEYIILNYQLSTKQLECFWAKGKKWKVVQ